MKMEMGLAFSCLSPCCGESNWCFHFLSKVSESSSSHVLRHSSNGQPYTLLREWKKSPKVERGKWEESSGGRNFGEEELFILQRPDSAQSFKWITGKQWPIAKSLLCNKQGDICEIFLSARALPWDWLFSMVLESEYILGSLMCLSFFF